MGLLQRIFKRNTPAEDPSWVALQNYQGKSYIPSYAGRAAEQLSAVTACVQLISRSIAALEPRIMRQTKRVDNHALTKILRNPSGDQSWDDFMQLMTASFLYEGNAVAFIDEQETELVFAPWSYVSLRGTANETAVYDISRPTVDGTSQRATTMRIPKSRVLHWRDMTGSRDGGIYGRSVVQRCSDVVALAASTERSVQTYMDNGLRPSGAFVFKAKLNPEQRKSYQQALSDAYSNKAGKHGNDLLLDSDMTYQVLGSNYRDASLNDQRKADTEAIARIFSVPAWWLTSDATTFASAVESRAALYGTTLFPIIKSFEAAFTVKFLEEDVMLKLDVSEFTQGNVRARQPRTGDANATQ